MIRQDSAESAGNKMTTTEALRQKYCPPLDEPLVLALASDVDLDDDKQKKQLEEWLDELKSNAVLEQEQELALPVTRVQPQENGDASSDQQATGTTEDENITSLTSGLSAFTTSEGTESSIGYQNINNFPEGLDSGSTSDKERWLEILFPTIESVQIQETVAKCNGDLQRSIDELLNLSFIAEDIEQKFEPPVVPKGIEGFLGEGKRKKPKKKRYNHFVEDMYNSDSAGSSSAATPETNVWDQASRDVDFIVSRTELSTSYVNSIYHQNSASLSRTLKTLVLSEANTPSAMIDSGRLRVQGDKLKLMCEDVPENYLYGALFLTKMNPSTAKDLIDAMITQPDAARTEKLVAQYTPTSLSDDEKRSQKSKPRSPVPLVDSSQLAGQASMHMARATAAFDKASAAHRKGRSQKLMGGAAAFYAQVGHEQIKKHKEHIAAASDARVAQQSTATTLDLHGVTVEHALRIAKEKVEDWWEGLEDRKYRVGGVDDGYRIIVGVGTHSSGGIGRIGPAVSKMLMHEGWKVNIQRGEIIVEGRTRKT